MIRHITIEHFKSIGKVDLELSPVTVLVGANGTGKSNFIDAIRFVKDAVQFDLDRAVSERHGIDSIRQWSPRKPYYVKIELTFSTRGRNSSGSYEITLGSKSGHYQVVREEGSWLQDVELDDFFTDDQGEVQEVSFMEQSTLQFVRDRKGHVTWTETLGDLERVTTFDVDSADDLILSSAVGRIGEEYPASTHGAGVRALRRAVHDIETYSIFPNTLRTPQTPSTDARLHSNGDNLTSIFRAMSRRKSPSTSRSEIIDSMKLIMPQLDTIIIQSIGGLMVPTFKVRESDDLKHNFNVSQISDGTLRVLGLLTALYQPTRPGVIALEEPEQTINPAVLSVIAEAIHDVGRRSQVIVTTHSPHFVDSFPPETIRAVELVGDSTKIAPITESQVKAVHDRLFTLGELMTVEGLYGS